MTGTDGGASALGSRRWSAGPTALRACVLAGRGCFALGTSGRLDVRRSAGRNLASPGAGAREASGGDQGSAAEVSRKMLRPSAKRVPRG